MSKDKPNPNLMVLNRNYTLHTQFGHTIQFKKGEPTHVPPICRSAALAVGALPPDGSDPNILGDDDIKKAPVDPAERNKLIMTAIELLVEKNERTDFAASGSPHPKAVSREVGFNVDSKELAGVLQAYHNALEEAKKG